MSTPREVLEAAWRRERPPRIPFAPAIYEHKAALVDSTPSRVCREAALLEAACLEEYARYGCDLVVVGIDVYNVEAEALGCRVTYFEGGDASVPGIESGGAVLGGGAGPGALCVPDPARDGRLPLQVEVARRVRSRIGGEVTVLGAMSGPFSLACELCGAEDFVIRCSEDPGGAERVLSFCGGVLARFGEAYLAAGVEPVVFDSRCAPPMISPATFRSLAGPAARVLVGRLRAAGARTAPYVIGGRTTSVVEDYLALGSGSILCDFAADWSVFRERCGRAGVSVRRNIDPAILRNGTPEDIRAGMSALAGEGAELPGFIAGTGVLPFDTPGAAIRAARDAVRDVRI